MKTLPISCIEAPSASSCIMLSFNPRCLANMDGTRYLGKIFNDDWMRDHGFLERKFATAQDIIDNKNGSGRLL